LVKRIEKYDHRFYLDVIMYRSKIKKEFIIFAVCFIASAGLTVYSVSRENNIIKETFDQMHIVLAISFVIYILVFIFRIIFIGFNRITKQK